MPKCDFNKVKFIETTLAWIFSCKFAAYFKNIFSKKIFGWLCVLLEM